ncbi:MAG: zinc-ribbon domain-containing protein, partial [Psychrobacillus psychrodurans]
GHGCGFCTGNFITYEKSIVTQSPELVRFFHPFKNQVSPSEVAPTSQRKIWWMCEQNHEWEEKVNKQAKRKACPICLEI